MTFDEWLEEIEVYSARWERLESDVDFAAVMMGNMSHNLARRRMYSWLEAAYKVGYEAGVESTKTFPFPNVHPTNPDSHIPPQRCSKCGLDLTKPMGYVCNDSQCPTFLRVTSMNFGTKSTDGYNG